MIHVTKYNRAIKIALTEGTWQRGGIVPEKCLQDRE